MLSSSASSSKRYGHRCTGVVAGFALDYGVPRSIKALDTFRTLSVCSGPHCLVRD
jgi:hypothetical protein